MTTDRPHARLRLPEGFSHLRPDLGKIIKDYRTGVKGFVGPIKQQDLAEKVGITRLTLSRIENGHTWPQADTLARIIGELEFDYPEVAVRGVAVAPATRFDGTRQGVRTYVLGQQLRIERRALEWTLAELSRRSGISAPHLSRIERAEVGRSAVYTWHPEDLNLPPEDRRIVFANSVLADVVAGRFEKADEQTS